MNALDFMEEIAPGLKGYHFQYRFFADGDFGDLARVEFVGNDKIGAVEFWSKGWLSLDVVDIKMDKQVLNLLLSPDENQQEAIDILVGILSDNALN